MGYNLNPEKKNANLLMIIPWKTFLADSNQSMTIYWLFQQGYRKGKWKEVGIVSFIGICFPFMSPSPFFARDQYPP